MDVKTAKKNIITSMVLRIVILALTIPVRSLMISKLGNEITGVYSLFNNMITVLSLAESGIGVAIIFSMYSKIEENKKEEITGLFKLFSKYYNIIGISIFILGLLAAVLLQFFIKEDVAPLNIYIPYFLMILSTSLSYRYASKISLMNAYKDNYKTTIITSSAYVVQYVLQIIIMYTFGSFVLYSIMILLGILIQWLLTSIIYNKQYKNRLSSESILKDETKLEVISNVKAMLSHKIGTVLFASTNGFIISIVIGVVILGVYNNYMTIVLALVSILSLMFASITSVLGHAYLKETPEIFYKTYKGVKLINYMSGFACFVGFMIFQDTVIPIVFKSGIYLTNVEVLLLCIGQFLQYMRQSNILFREATGVFNLDKYRPVYEVLLNIILSLILVNLMGLKGILIANIVVTLTITSVIEPLVIYKNVFKVSFRKEMFDYIKKVIVFILFLSLSMIIVSKINDGKIIIVLLKKVLVYLAILTIYLVYILYKKNNRDFIFNIINKIKKREG